MNSTMNTDICAKNEISYQQYRWLPAFQDNCKEIAVFTYKEQAYVL